MAGAMHSMQPDFLEDQLDRSRANLGLDTVDVFYLHNPEIQLRFVARAVFEQRLQAAFERCERLVKERKIRWYGAATWTGFLEPEQLDLARMIELARYVGGEDHHFRFIQLPFNLAMIEAYQNRDQQGVSVLKVAGRANITVVASATLHQARLARDMPGLITGRIPGFNTDAARAIQFTRSTPGISVALVGMSRPPMFVRIWKSPACRPWARWTTRSYTGPLTPDGSIAVSESGAWRRRVAGPAAGACCFSDFRGRRQTVSGPNVRAPPSRIAAAGAARYSRRDRFTCAKHSRSSTTG